MNNQTQTNSWEAKMKDIKSLIINSLIVVMFLFFISACQESTSLTEPTGGSDYDEIKKVIDEDEIIQSFEPNYNEDEAMDLLTDGLAKVIYPVRVGQKMVLTNKNIDIDIKGDTAYAFITNTFRGILFIAVSYHEFSTIDDNTVDTLIQKEFTTTMTRNVVLAKRDDAINLLRKWKIVKISLTEGGVTIAVASNSLGERKINGAKQLAQNGYQESAIIVAKETYRKYPSTSKNIDDRIYFANLFSTLDLNNEALEEFSAVSKMNLNDDQRKIIDEEIEKIKLVLISN